MKRFDIDRIPHLAPARRFFSASFGAAKQQDSIEADWLGVPMVFTPNGREENMRLLQGAELRLERPELRTEIEEARSPSTCMIGAKGRAGEVMLRAFAEPKGDGLGSEVTFGAR